MKPLIPLLLILISATLAFADAEVDFITLQTNGDEAPTGKFGLENAILNVQNETQKQHLQEVLDKIQAKRITQLRKLYHIHVEKKGNETILEGTGDAKLFGFLKVKKQYRYHITEEWALEQIPRWYHFFFKLNDPIIDENG